MRATASGIGEINPFGAHSELGKHLFEQAHGAAVEVLFAEHQISLAQGGGNRSDRAHSRTKHRGVAARLH